ncbi:hypothetical protein ACRAWF_09710 [Streptomyces sp. L7]
MRALGSRADNIDPDWTWDFQRRGDAVIRTLRPQHALAHEGSPVRLTLTTRPEAMDAVPIRPNRTSTGAGSPGRGAMVTTAMSEAASADQDSASADQDSASAVHSPGRSGSNRTCTDAAPSST